MGGPADVLPAKPTFTDGPPRARNRVGQADAEPHMVRDELVDVAGSVLGEEAGATWKHGPPLTGSAAMASAAGARAGCR